jgi:glycosyltransferase involved in cell wall biosynthesis
VPTAELWFVGDGPPRPRLEALREPGVRVWGRLDERNKLDVLSRAHALVVTSVREGWGLVVDEAAAVGTPTIAYDVAGLRDAVPAANGVLVRPRPVDLAQTLAQRLPGLTRQPPRRGWRGGAVDWDTVAKEVLIHVEAAA